MENKVDIFHLVWVIIRDCYAPSMTAPAAARYAVSELTKWGHEAVIMGGSRARSLMVDGELFEIKKYKGWSHFELIQHGIR